jgi:hypothetical protein
MTLAADRALGVTELFELTLSNLPMRDPSLAQRVSKQWKTVIVNSSSLQRIMWLTPYHQTEVL